VTALLAAAGGLYGQIAGAGVIQGTITDATGAVVPGAEATAVGLATGVKATARTTGAGFFVLTPLSAGEYNVTASAKGFQTMIREKVVVNALSIVEANFSLRVGATTQQITVTAAPPILNTSDATLGNTVSNESYTALPLTMGMGGVPGGIGPRNPESFVYLLPGVSTGNGFSCQINGGGVLTKEIYIDGMPLKGGDVQGENRPLAVGISVDAVDQFRVLTNGAPAQYDGQGIENFVVKSGTNKFHGSGYEYLRNKVFDARTFFSATVPVEKQNEFGFTVGGPVIKNRIFFFGNLGLYKRRAATSPTFDSLPTSAEQKGDFSALPFPIYDPATMDCLTGVCTRQAFPDNIIPATRISSIAKYFQGFLPPTINNNLQNNYLGALQSGENNDNYLIRIDAQISDKHRIFALHNYGKNSTVGIYNSGETSLPLPIASSRGNAYVEYLEQFGDSYVITPSLLNEFSVSYNWFNQPFWNYTTGGDYVQKSGLTGISPSFTQFPGIGFSGPDSPSIWADEGRTSAGTALNPGSVIRDDVQWLHGKHSVKFGTTLSFMQRSSGGPVYPSAQFNFSNTETAGFDAAGNLLTGTGNAYASYLLGLVDNANTTVNAAGVTGARFRNYAFYVQDDFKATNRLMINIGLRYSIATPMFEVYNRFAFLDPTAPNPAIDGAPGALTFAGYGPGKCNCRTPARTHHGDFGPRVGLAYKLNDKTVLRAAYGIFYTRAGDLGSGGIAPSTDGYSATPSFGTPDGGKTQAFTLAQGFPAFAHPPFFDPTIYTGYTTTTPYGVGGPSYIDPYGGGKAPYYEDWNFTVQRQVTPTLSVTAAYAASAGHFLSTGIGNGIWSNQINPKYLALGSLLIAPATPANIALADARFPEVKLPYANFSGPIGQALLPFPQYSGINDRNDKIGNSTFNSLQVGVEKKFTRGLSYLIAYTWSKEIDDAGSSLGGFFGASGRTAYNNSLAKSVGVMDMPQTLVLSPVYQLPFGSGHALGNSNAVVKAVVSGWQVSAVLTYRSGLPLGSYYGAGNAPFTGGAFADFNPNFTGSARINGSWGSKDVLGPNPPAYIDVNAFQNPAPYTLGNTPRDMAYNIRNPATLNEDLALRREFHIWEDVRFQIEGNAFNAFNRVAFGCIGTSITSSSFGTVGCQGGSYGGMGRMFQFLGKIVF